MGITNATGALGNTSGLLGTAEQVADAILGSACHRSWYAASIRLLTPPNLAAICAIEIAKRASHAAPAGQLAGSGQSERNERFRL
jgi:hypothetical protein